MVTLIIGALVFALDYATKWLVMTRMAEHQSIPVIPGFFHLTYVMNPGAAFGILKHQKWLFVLVTLATVVTICYYAFRPEGRRPMIFTAMGLILGGALGNLFDRIRFNAVVDMFDFFWRDWHYPVFNVADMAIVCGVGLFILRLLLDARQEQNEKAGQET
jgi:signal peptidase II